MIYHDKGLLKLTIEQPHIYAKPSLEDHPSEELHDSMERRLPWYGINEKMTGMLSMYCAYMPCQRVPTAAWIGKVKQEV